MSWLQCLGVMGLRRLHSGAIQNKSEPSHSETQTHSCTHPIKFFLSKLRIIKSFLCLYGYNGISHAEKAWVFFWPVCVLAFRTDPLFIHSPNLKRQKFLQIWSLLIKGLRAKFMYIRNYVLWVTNSYHLFIQSIEWIWKYFHSKAVTV